MDEGSEQPDNTPRPDDKTVIGNDATVVDGGAGSPGVSIPREIGPYKVKRPIGAGGMGTVVLAQQESPRRDVAIKIMNPGVVSRKALRRFEFEAQTLGRLQHPAIAQVYEAGTFDDGSGGRPYFAMEYVSSAKELGDYVTDKQLDTVARLELFRAFCEGVEYGHRRGVIHRDLKPGNILVDAEGHPKIIDFGVARSTESDSVTATLATEAGQLIGTLQYMSPEQVELDPGDLDTRSDVYALGVILYQLLVDKLPYDLTGASLTKAGQLIKETQPARISDINSNLKGDLETICLKALEKDRDQRYQSVGDLSDDIRRYLADEPIMARPPTRAEQFRRLVRKNKAAAVATGVVAAALVAATTISIVFAVEASRQRDQASRQRDVARAATEEAQSQRDAAELAKREAEAQRTLAEAKTAEVQKQAEEMKVMLDFQQEQLTDFDFPKMGTWLYRQIQDDLQPAILDDSFDSIGMARLLVNKFIYERAIESINEQFADQPVVQAKLLADIGQAYEVGGFRQEAIELFRQVLAVSIATYGKEHEQSLKSMERLAWWLTREREFDEASPIALELLDISERTLGKDHRQTIRALNALGSLLLKQKSFEESSDYFLEAIERESRRKGEESSGVCAYRMNYANCLKAMGRLDEAIEEYEAVREIRRRHSLDDTDDGLLLRDNIGTSYRQRKEPEKALELHEGVLKIRLARLGPNHPETEWSCYLMGRANQVLATQFEDDQDWPMALQASEEAIGFFGRGGSSETNRRRLSGAHQKMADIHEAQGSIDAALVSHQQALAVLRDAFGDDHDDSLEALVDIGNLLSRHERRIEGLSYYAEWLEILRRSKGNASPEVAHALRSLWNIEISLNFEDPEGGHLEKATAYFEELKAIQAELDAIDTEAEEPVAP